MTTTYRVEYEIRPAQAFVSRKARAEGIKAHKLPTIGKHSSPTFDSEEAMDWYIENLKAGHRAFNIHIITITRVQLDI